MKFQNGESLPGMETVINRKCKIQNHRGKMGIEVNSKAATGKKKKKVGFSAIKIK